jgi:hypothetical protein
VTFVVVSLVLLKIICVLVDSVVSQVHEEII